uniref:Uncharacterized protein n=1 Tax=Cannabis sativa TaxID=3483 RepID=A0A803Q4V4_CANSA
MAITRRTLATTPASSGLPQDLMTVNPDVHVPATAEISTNPTDVANPTNPAVTKKLTNTIGNMEQSPSTRSESGPRYYAGDTGLRIGEPTIGEPHVLGRRFQIG